MKKYLLGLYALVALIATPFFLSSCSDDDDDNIEITPSSMAGKWICYEEIWDDDGDIESFSYTEEDNMYLQLNADLTGSVGDVYLFENEIRGSFTWITAGNKLAILEDNNDYTEYTIIRITANELILEWLDQDESGYSKETHKFRKAVSQN